MWIDLFLYFPQGLGAELTEKDKKFLHLVEMGYAEDEVSSAIDICGNYYRKNICDNYSRKRTFGSL